MVQTKLNDFKPVETLTIDELFEDVELDIDFPTVTLVTGEKISEAKYRMLKYELGDEVELY
jgi:hypothetical protein